MTDFSKYEEYYKNTLLALMNAPSPSGYYIEVMPVIKELAEAWCSKGQSIKPAEVRTMKPLFQPVFSSHITASRTFVCQTSKK